MKYLVILTTMLVICAPIFVNSNFANKTENTSEILSRRKRYVTFPEGSSFSMAACMTVGVIGNPMPGIFTWGMNWGIAYELPNETMALGALRRFHKLPRPVIARRFRRDLYSKMEIVMKDMGYDGRECIYRALCEAAQRLMPTGNSVIEELFRTIFSVPLGRFQPSEPSEHRLYGRAHKNGRSGVECRRRYRGCPLSLLDLALGYYTPLSNANYRKY